MNLKKIIAMLLLLAFAATMITAIPIAAQEEEPPTMKTYPIIDAIPNPVGVGEQTLIRTGILQQLGTVDLGWEGVTVEVVKPDNSTETLGPLRTDSTGSTFTIYTPEEVGTYRLTTHFPEQANPVGFLNFEGGNFIAEGTIMLESTSETLELVVQADPLTAYPDQPLPTEYWSRPIDPQLRSWYTIAGNWVDRPKNSWALYNEGPRTPHVLWSKPLTTGGLIGGLWGPGQVPVSAETGDAYEGKFPGSIILNGILYYNRVDPGTESAIIAVNLHTGEDWLYKNNSQLSFGQILYFNSYNYDGVFTYIWVTSGAPGNETWVAYDPFSGAEQIRITNVPSGTRTYGPSGEILIYQIDYENNWLALWNSTDCGLQNAEIGTPDYGSWGNTAHGDALGLGLNGTNPRCYSWNVSIQPGLTAGQSFFTPILEVFPDRVMSVDFNLTRVRVWALSTEPDEQGTLLFDKVWPAPAEWLEGTNTLHYVGATNEGENGVIAVWSKELRKHYGFSTETGDFLWETESENYADAYGWGNVEHTWYFAYDHLYSVGVAGIVYAYSLETGDIVWTYEMDDPYNEPVTGNNWWGWISLITDGIVYVGTLEHSAEMPLPRGGPFIALNATTGDVIWRVNGMFRQTRWGGNAILGDSIIATMDTYDQQVYAIGKGPSAITFTASPKVSIEGSSVIVEGAVTDISPGTKDPEIALRFPNGVPAVSDESQSEWMLYVYKQFERPSNVTGVPLSIDVIDANGNFRNVGTTTTDRFGTFSFDWIPDITGRYTVMISFVGSDAYYPSFAQSAFVVDAAGDGDGGTGGDGDGESPADMYFIPAVIGIIVAIVVVGIILALLLLRRRP